MAAASTLVRQVLLGPATRAEVIGAFPTAGYLLLPGGDVVALLAREAVRLPVGVVLPDAARPALGRLARGEVVVVGGGLIALPGAPPVRVARWWDPAVPRLRFAARPAVRFELPPGIAGRGLDVEALLGLGPGLTPAGDDVLAGALAAARSAGSARFAPLAAAVLGALERRPAATSALSAALLRAAAAGAGVPPLVRFLRALAAGRDVGAAAGSLRAVGHSSGAALGAGALLGVAA
jgi:uncharacterized protein DUF2877